MEGEWPDLHLQAMPVEESTEDHHGRHSAGWEGDLSEAPNRLLIPSPEGKPFEISGVETETEIHWFPNYGPKHQTKDCWCSPQMDFEFHTGRPIFRHRETIQPSLH